MFVLCVSSGPESTADLPRGSNALLWQETRSLEVRLLHEQSWDQRSGLCHHLRYSNDSHDAVCEYECGVPVFYTFYCLIQERFRKCWRRKTCLLIMWSLQPQIQCKFCASLLFVASFRINCSMNFQKNRWTHTVHFIPHPGSAVFVGMSSWAMLGVGQEVTSIMSSPMLPSSCLEKKFRNSPTRPSGESVSRGLRRLRA